MTLRPYIKHKKMLGALKLTENTIFPRIAKLRFEWIEIL